MVLSFQHLVVPASGEGFAESIRQLLVYGKQMQQTHADDEIEISLTDLAKSLYAGRWFILLFSAACVAIALGVAFVTAQYKSTSFWYFEDLVKSSSNDKGISRADYNRIMDSAKSLRRFEAYLTVMKLPDSAEPVELLRKLFSSREGIDGIIKPFRSSLTDSKEVQKTAPILGVSIEITANSKELAHDALLLLSNYLVDTLAYDFYYDRLLSQREQYQIRDAEIENSLMELGQKRKQRMQQQELVERLIEKYANPFATSRNAERLIAIEDSLSSSPIDRLMTLQLEIAELDAQQKVLARQQKQTDFFRRYYQQALKLYQETGSSSNFFSQLPAVLASVFADEDKSEETVKEVYNRLLVESETARNLYKQSRRQMVKPSQPNQPTTRFALLAAASLLGALMLASLLTLMRAWWREVTAQTV